MLVDSGCDEPRSPGSTGAYHDVLEDSSRSATFPGGVNLVVVSGLLEELKKGAEARDALFEVVVILDGDFSDVPQGPGRSRLTKDPFLGAFDVHLHQVDLTTADVIRQRDSMDHDAPRARAAT